MKRHQLHEIKLKLTRKSLQVVGAILPGAAAQYALKLFSSPQRYQRPSWEVKLLESAKPLELKSKHISGLYAHSWGDDGAPKILLVHGWAGRGTQLAAFVEPLVTAGFQVIAFDGPAHGDSPGRKTNIQFFTNVLVILSRELGPFHGVIAHSFGAGATILALDRGFATSRAILIASPSNLQRVIDTFSGYLQLKKSVADAMQSQLEEWAGIDMENLDLNSKIPRMTVPAMIVHDPEDREVSFKNAEILNSRWRHSQLLSVPKVGHRRILRAPAVLEAATDFMKSQISRLTQN